MPRRSKELVAAEATQNPGVPERLEQALDSPQDRGWVICSDPACTHNDSRHCTIYTQGKAPKMKRAPADRLLPPSAGEEDH